MSLFRFVPPFLRRCHQCQSLRIHPFLIKVDSNEMNIKHFLIGEHSNKRTTILLFHAHFRCPREARWSRTDLNMIVHQYITAYEELDLRCMQQTYFPKRSLIDIHDCVVMLYILMLCFDLRAAMAVQILHNATYWTRKEQLSLLAEGRRLPGEIRGKTMIEAWNEQNMIKCERTNQASVRLYREKLHELTEDTKECGWRAFMEYIGTYRNLYGTDDAQIEFNYSMRSIDRFMKPEVEPIFVVEPEN
jgi:hypothetical protein